MSEFVVAGNSTYSKRPSNFPENFPKHILWAEGAEVMAEGGKMFFDTTACLGAVLLGYLNKEVTNAVDLQLENGGPLFPLPTLEEDKAAQAICGLTGWEQVKFGKNGSDATEAAVRLARYLATSDKGKDSYILTNSYHGFHSDTIGAQPGRSGGVLPINLISVFRTHTIDDIMRWLDNSEFAPAALLMEPVSPTIQDWNWEMIKKRCEERGTLLIFDEVLSGFRYGVQGGMGWLRVRPHLACYGKAMANGYPLSCIAGPRELMQHFEKDVFFSGTYMEETFSLAACTATLGQLDAHLYKKLHAYGHEIMDLFDVNCRHLGIAARAIGHGVRFQLTFKNALLRTRFVAAMCDLGFLLGRDWFVTKAMIEEVGLEKIEEAFQTSLKGLN